MEVTFKVPDELMELAHAYEMTLEEIVEFALGAVGGLAAEPEGTQIGYYDIGTDHFNRLPLVVKQKKVNRPPQLTIVVSNGQLLHT